MQVVEIVNPLVIVEPGIPHLGDFFWPIDHPSHPRLVPIKSLSIVIVTINSTGANSLSLLIGNMSGEYYRELSD